MFLYWANPVVDASYYTVIVCQHQTSHYLFEELILSASAAAGYCGHDKPGLASLDERGRDVRDSSPAYASFCEHGQFGKVALTALAQQLSA